MKKFLFSGLLGILILTSMGCTSSQNNNTNTTNQTPTNPPIEVAYSMKPEASSEKANTYIKVNSNNTTATAITVDIYIDNELYIKEVLSPNSKTTLNYAYGIAANSHTLKVTVNGTDKFQIPFNTTSKNQWININYDSGNSVTDVTATIGDVAQ